MSPVEQILDLARWAPSGDNTQPWRFEIVGDYHLRVHGFDTRDHCVYDLDGHPSQISMGALLETVAIAATGSGLRATCTRCMDAAETRPVFDVWLASDPAITPNPLIPFIRQRSVQRRPLHMRALTVIERSALERAAGADYRIQWLQGLGTKLRAARLMFNNAGLRLTLPEAFAVHRDVIQWNARYSEDRIPDQALGVDPLTARVMRFAMHSWPRIAFLNRYLAGTWAPRIQMDLIPSIACGAHFVIAAAQPASSIDDYIAAGRAVQRFWLTATMLGLQMQPELTPLIFARYARNGVRFSAMQGADEKARTIAKQLQALIGDPASDTAVFMGRMGAGPHAAARSTRRPLESLYTAQRMDGGGS